MANIAGIPFDTRNDIKISIVVIKGYGNKVNSHLRLESSGNAKK